LCAPIGRSRKSRIWRYCASQAGSQAAIAAARGSLARSNKGKNVNCRFSSVWIAAGGRPLLSPYSPPIPTDCLALVLALALALALAGDDDRSKINYPLAGVEKGQQQQETRKPLPPSNAIGRHSLAHGRIRLRRRFDF